jgi:hypothetical protein
MHHRRIAIGITLALSFTAATAAKLLPTAEAACCYFAAKDKDILQPGQKAFINWDPVTKQESFTVQPKFEGNALDFGMVIPTPSRPKLDEMPRDFFKDLAIYTILMPLPEPIYPPSDPNAMVMEKAAMSLAGGALPPPPAAGQAVRKQTVKVLESGVVGSLDYKIILAENARDLFDWLKQNKYSYAGDEGTLRFYIDKKSYFTVMKIDPKQMKKGRGGSYTGEVTPTRFSFTSAQCYYPLKITQISVKDQTDALFYVQSPQQMDLAGDWSWMHSYRPMYLTYMLGCAVNPQEQVELDQRTRWLEAKQSKNPNYETTKLEWAKKLGPAELAVLEDPQKNYAKMGTGELPPGSKVIALPQMIAEMKSGILKQHKNQLPSWAKDGFVRMEDQYQPAKGTIIRHDDKIVGRGYIYSKYEWYPARDVPLEDVRGLTRLKGMLRDGQWLTKFRKQIRRNEMNQDLVLAAVPKIKEQTYIRIMPTSPP